jgi:hypothetical protein
MTVQRGYSVFTAAAVQDRATTVSRRAYEKWRKDYIFNALKFGVAYGDDFCNHFNIVDYILCYTRDPDRADDHIQKHYIK